MFVNVDGYRLGSHPISSPLSLRLKMTPLVYEPCHVKNTALAYAKTKVQISWMVTVQRLFFATYIVQSTCFQNLKF